MGACDIVMLAVGAPRRRRGAVLGLGARLQDALVECLSTDRAALTVRAGRGVVTVRGEVGSLELISRASREIDAFHGDTEIVYLVRLRRAAD